MGGEHKCPVSLTQLLRSPQLCSATFTRPQHVGRHLRAHTGDRPYECKECPLRFARSDLLSRHVNKAHPKPDGQGDKNKNEKRGRRKSVSSQNPATSGISASRPLTLPHAVPQAPPTQQGTATLSHPEHTAFQAQRMYPNHPLLQPNGGNSQLWAAQQSFALGHPAPYGTNTLGNMNVQGMQGFAAPMSVGGMDVLTSGTFDPTLPNSVPQLGLDLAVKKRACDQCNHSKVRCDCAEPCGMSNRVCVCTDGKARCAHRSIQCTYTKQRTRAAFVPPVITTGVDGLPTQPFSGISPTSGRRNSPLPSSQGRLSSDGTTGLSVRPPVPDPQWDNMPQSANAATVSLDCRPVSKSLLTPQSDGGMLHQSPGHVHMTMTDLGMSLTPALTNATSPSTTDASGSDRRTGSASGQWMLPPSSIPGVDYGGIQTDSIGLASSFHGTTNFFRSSIDSGFDTSDTSPSYTANLSSEDDDNASIGLAGEKDGEGQERLSGSGQWATAIDGLHLDDSQGLNFDGSGNMPFGFAQAQRGATYPMASNELPASLSRAPSGQDANFWKLFLDPSALASPDVQGELHPGSSLDTPRGLSKSNSMPDLKTPPTATAHYGPLQFPSDATSIPTGPPGQQARQTGQQTQHRAHSDDTDMERWRAQIQQRHASFSMNMSASTAARKVTTGELNSATFASGNQRPARPPPNPLFSNSAMQQTLAPERTPSFGLMAFDQTTPKGNPRTPTAQLLSMYTGFERPSNKRVASQTLVPEIFGKRQQTFAPDDDGFIDMTPSGLSSRRSSEQLSAFASHHRPSLPSGLSQTRITPAPTETH